MLAPACSSCATLSSLLLSSSSPPQPPALPPKLHSGNVVKKCAKLCAKWYGKELLYACVFKLALHTQILSPLSSGACAQMTEQCCSYVSHFCCTNHAQLWRRHLHVDLLVIVIVVIAKSHISILLRLRKLHGRLWPVCLGWRQLSSAIRLPVSLSISRFRLCRLWLQAGRNCMALPLGALEQLRGRVIVPQAPGRFWGPVQHPQICTPADWCLTCCHCSCASKSPMSAGQPWVHMEGVLDDMQLLQPFQAGAR